MGNNTKNGHFINGRSQVIELLKGLTLEEKNKILRGLSNINPSMASELSNESITFEQLEDYSQEQLKAILWNITPTIVGMALKGVNKKMQRRILSLLAPDDAEEAFAVLMERVTNENVAALKAQDKILNNLMRIHSGRFSNQIN